MRICLIVMPFSTTTRPALGVSLLKASLHRCNVLSNVFYFNIEFAEMIGFDVYEKLISTRDFPLLGELIFSPFIHDNQEKKHHEYWFRDLLKKKLLRNNPGGLTLEELNHIHKIIPEYLEGCACRILRARPSLIGFTSTFEQHCASVALSRLIKNEEYIPIIFGGANCEGEMGIALLELFSHVDFVCSGEGDISFVEFVKHLRNDSIKTTNINGILSRASSRLDVALTSPVLQMDDLPFPDFDDYFCTYARSSIKKHFEPQLVIETSRGCWWGEKFQCTFCGLNGLTMKFRSKSIYRIIAELKHLNKHYGIKRFYVVDNIMDLKFINTLFPAILSEGLDIELFYETKSNLSRTDLKTLREGGVVAIQPGIESLSTAVLHTMKKGVQGTANIELLKWCSEFGVIPLWNWLWGFPGEPMDEYDVMAELVPLLTHLYPPDYGKIILDRFSPYFVDPESYGICNVRPWKVYGLLYGPDVGDKLRKIAYHFDFDYRDGRDPSQYTQKLQSELQTWNSLWKNGKDEGSRPVLGMAMKKDGLMMIKDTRPVSSRRYHLLSDEEAKIYNVCRTSHSYDSIRFSARASGGGIGKDLLDRVLSGLIDKKIMVYLDNKYLSLAVQSVNIAL